jgi:hypothetical protein
MANENNGNGASERAAAEQMWRSMHQPGTPVPELPKSPMQWDARLVRALGRERFVKALDEAQIGGRGDPLAGLRRKR